MEPKITSCNLKEENAMQGLMTQLKLLFWLFMQGTNLWIFIEFGLFSSIHLFASFYLRLLHLI